MSLDSYANLKLEIASFSARADTSTSVGGADTFIDLTEAWFNRNLRVRQMIRVNPALDVDVNGALSHPADWLAWKQVVMMTQPIRELRIYDEQSSVELDHSNAVLAPKAVIVRGSASQIWPVPDATYTYRGVYWQRIPALADAMTTNWLLASYPEAYLYGALLNLAVRLQDGDGMQSYSAAFQQVVNEINTASNVDAYGAGIGSPVVPHAV